MKLKFQSILGMFFLLCSVQFPTIIEGNSEKEEIMKPTLTLIGHASMKIKTAEGVVIYIDPYYDGDYSEGADIILSTHEHFDHNVMTTVDFDCLLLSGG